MTHTTAGAPGEELLEAIQEDLESKREIAVDVQVKAPQETEVDVTLTLQTAPEAEFAQVKAAAEAAVQNYFTGARLGAGVLLSQLYAALHEVDGLENYHILSPEADLTPSTTVLPLISICGALVAVPP